MVTQEARQTAMSVQDLLDDRDIIGMAAIAGSTAGGILLTQRIADRVLPMIGMPTTPSSLLEGLASAGVKGGIALAFGFAAAQVTGLPMVIAAFLAFGAITAAGVDLLGVFFEVPELRAMMNGAGLGGSSRRLSANRGRPVRANQSRTVRRSTGTTNDNVEFRQNGGSNEEVVFRSP